MWAQEYSFYPRPLSNETKSISIQISGQNVGNDDLNFNSHCQFDSNIHNFEKYAQHKLLIYKPRIASFSRSTFLERQIKIYMNLILVQLYKGTSILLSSVVQFWGTCIRYIILFVTFSREGYIYTDHQVTNSSRFLYGLSPSHPGNTKVIQKSNKLLRYKL